MKQFDLFGPDENKDSDTTYTSKIEAPIYEPSNKKPHVLELVDIEKTRRLVGEINGSNLSQGEKDFLIEAAHRHSTFDYSKVADYYAHSTKEMQHFMERSALVIIDFKKAIQYGYVKLSEDIRQQYLNEYGED